MSLYKIETPCKLGDYLKNNLKLSAGIVTDLKKSPLGILLNGNHVTVRAEMQKGDVLSLSLDDTFDDENPALVPLCTPITVLYEDEDLLACDKPFAMPTHPSLHHFDDTLANAVLYYYHKQNRPFVFRAVNRLDEDTSGVVLIAKNRLSAYHMSAALQNGSMTKTYLAVAEGDITFPGKICGYISRESGSIIKRILTKTPLPGSDYAETDYEPLAVKDGLTLLRVMPKTGRTHQIRVSFAAIGHPLFGDDFYGGTRTVLKRQALHAYSLSFPHPANNKIREVISPLPTDIASLFPDFSV